MAEVLIGPHSRYRNNLIDEHAASKVILWDCGPEPPTPPERPEAPHGKAGDIEYDLALLDARDKLAAYEADLKTFKQRKTEYDDWVSRNGGAIEKMFWSCDARDALGHDARAVQEGRQSRLRYYLSSKTRGYGHLPNGGLPPDQAPGRGHQANLDRQAADDRAMALARQNDPVFGGTE
jgi:hypothetical protein